MLVMSAAAAFAADPPPPARVEAAMGKGLTVTSGDGRFSINVKGRVQLRESVDVTATDDDGLRHVGLATQLGTARLWLGGHLGSNDIHYLLQLALAPRDYRDGAISPVFDAYFDVTQSPSLTVRVGQMFVPFDRLRTIRELALQFPDRPRGIGELTLDRDIGVYAWSEHLGGARSPVGYKLGVFGGSGIHQPLTHPPGGMALARLELRPLGAIDDDIEGDLTRREAPALAFGLAAAYNLNTTRARSTTSTTYTGGTADYLHLAADAVFKWRGVALEGELVARDAAADTIDVTAADGTPGEAYTRSGYGVITQASVMLTDHLEIASRYARLHASEGTDPAFVADAAAHRDEVGVSVNAYWNGHAFKLQSSIVGFVGEDGELGEINGRVMVDATF